MGLFEWIVVAVLFIILPLLADLLDNLFPKSGIGRIAQEGVSYVMVVFILFLCSSSFYLWATVYLPYYLLENPDTWVPIHMTYAIFVSFTGIFTYLRALEVDPGFLRRRKAPATTELNKSEQETANPPKRICNFCNVEKPIGTRHCKICGRCVKRMDHHCPFIAGCVGVNNHHYLVMFLFYVSLACLYAAYMAFGPFKRCYLDEDLTYEGCSLAGPYALAFPCVLAIMSAVGELLLWQSYVAYTGVPTVDLLLKMRHTPFKSWWKNWRDDFKSGKLSNTRRILGDNLLRVLFTPWRPVTIPAEEADKNK